MQNCRCHRREHRRHWVRSNTRPHQLQLCLLFSHFWGSPDFAWWPCMFFRSLGSTRHICTRPRYQVSSKFLYRSWNAFLLLRWVDPCGRSRTLAILLRWKRIGQSELRGVFPCSQISSGYLPLASNAKRFHPDGRMYSFPPPRELDPSIIRNVDEIVMVRCVQRTALAEHTI